LLDGATHNDVMNNLNLPLPFPDALQEFKIETSALPAQYGLHSSAAVNGVTKSGTNEFHGDLFEFLRNGVFNARDYFAAARDTLKRNQFGGTVGGPVLKDKLFFFAGYQGTFQRSDPPQSVAFVPTPQMLAGDFSTFAGPTCNAGKTVNLPASLGFVNNQISPTRFSTPAVKISSLLPLATNQCGRVSYGVLADNNEHTGVGRVDYQLSPKHSVFGRAVVANLEQPGSYDGKNPLTFASGTAQYRDFSVALGDTYLFGASIVNSFRATVTRTDVRKVPDKFIGFSDVGIQGVAQLVPNFLRVTVSGNGFGFGSANETPSIFPTGPNFQFADDVSIVHGSHQLGFGANFIRSEMNIFSGLNAVGGFTFNGSVTGLGLSDFLVGSASAWNQSGFSQGNNRQHYFATYFQDAWKATKKLTVNYGVRWEPYIAPWSKFGWYNHFDQGLFTQNVHSTVFPNAPAGLVFVGDPQYTVGGGAQNSRYNLFVPRVGLVWDPKGDGKMTVRASYGMFTDRQHLFYLDTFANDPPYGNNITLSNVNFSNPWATYPGGNPLPFTLSKNTTFPLFGAYVTHNLHAKTTYLNQWNLSIQRRVGSDWLLTINYLGNNTIHLWTGNAQNPAIFLGLGACNIAGVNYSTCSTTANQNQRRALFLQNPTQGQYYAGVSQMDDGGTATYDALFLSAQKRLSHGFTVLGNYTWSHCISDVANSELGTAGPLYVIPNNRRADRSNCALSDLRQAFNLSVVAQAPKFQNRAVKTIASDWTFSFIITAKTGPPYTVTTGVDNALTGQAAQRPNLVAGANAYAASPGCPNAPCIQSITAAAFSSAAAGTYGNLGPANLFGSGAFQLDVAVSRMFPIREKRSLQLRGEFFNLPNHLNPSIPVATLNSSNFGQIISDVNGVQTGGLLAGGGDPRIIQLALKFLF
ncbi:MAG TPA: TonB-dependent receptor, partial [Bryobacteraceae bacterium]|nr:TonB-dependent receptor [Bryobacteraceae bacterium]